MDRRDLERHVGDISQLFGIKDYIIIGSKADGMRIVDIYNSSGLSLSIMPDRGMDIASLSYKGINLGFLSKTGLTGSKYFNEDGVRGFMKSFNAGFLTTCGLSYMGAPCNDLGENLGLHGVISNTPAYEVCPSVTWQGEDAAISVSGKVKEAKVFGEHIILTRKISCGKDSRGFKITDTVENLGFEHTPLMILYHFNFGYPMLTEGAKLILPSKNVTPRDTDAQIGIDEYLKIDKPIDDYSEQVFFHEMNSDINGDVKAALVNDKLGLAVTINYKHSQLSQFTQWKSMKSGDYVLGFEPGNCHVNGRKEARKDGSLQYLGPGEIKRFDIEVSIMENKKWYIT